MIKLILFTFLFGHAAWASPADDLVAKSEVQTRGKTFQGEVTMQVERGDAKRTMVMNIMSVGREKAYVKIRKPSKDRDSGNLRLDLNLWQYLANIERVIKIPPSMMLQSWMGSDFTNDDLVKSSSLSADYTHKILAREPRSGFSAVKIECIPKPDAPVVWGKIILWVRDKDAVPLAQEFYAEGGELLKQMEGQEIKTFGTHTIPTTLVMKNLKNPSSKDSKTTMHYDKVVFDEPLKDSVFTQENLRKPL
ncbi:outer membrane lipoprotein-sorting protein [Bdellovibrionota bacterium FG-2]